MISASCNAFSQREQLRTESVMLGSRKQFKGLFAEIQTGFLDQNVYHLN